MGLVIFNTNKLIQRQNSYNNVPITSTLNYDISWQGKQTTKVKCQVTGGSCEVTLDSENKTAQVNWNTPNEPGDYEIVIFGGNSTFYNSFSDQVIVH